MPARLTALLLCLAAPALAGSQGDWFASLYTGEGIELRNDERIFTLFAIFNALGFDQGPVTRKDPVPKVIYHPVRQLVRGKVIGGDPEVRKAADAFFDAHPASLAHYLDFAVHAGSPPFKDPVKAKELQDLKGFEQVLARAWTGWKLDEALATAQQDYRRSLKAYLTVVDGPLLKERAIFKVPDSSEVILVVNLLDAQDQVRAEQGERGEAVLVVGPSDKPNVEGLLREYARLYVAPAVAKKISGWAGGAAVLREAQLAGVNEQTVQDYASALLSLAAALRAMDAGDAAYDAAAARGWFGIKDVAKMFDEGRPLEAMVLEAMQKVETRRPAKK